MASPSRVPLNNAPLRYWICKAKEFAKIVLPPRRSGRFGRSGRSERLEQALLNGRFEAQVDGWAPVAGKQQRQAKGCQI